MFKTLEKITNDGKTIQGIVKRLEGLAKEGDVFGEIYRIYLKLMT